MSRRAKKSSNPKVQDKFEHLLATFPGAKRAAHGVILPGRDGSFFHVTNIHSDADRKGLTQEESFFLAFCSREEILRLRELRTAHDYLLRLRAIAIVDSPRAVRVFVARRQRSPNWSLTNFYRGKNKYRNHYLSHLSDEHRAALKDIPAGFALIAEANAMCIGSLLGNVIVVSEALEHFFYYMNIAFYGGKLGIPMADRLAALLIAIRTMHGSESLDFDIDNRGRIPRAAQVAIRELVRAQMGFTFGHEYAHHLLNHLQTAKYIPLRMTEARPSDSSHSQFEARAYDHELEHEADLQAVQILQTGRENRTAIANAAFTSFQYFDLFKFCETLIPGSQRRLSDTHPRPATRLARLRERLPEEIGAGTSEIEVANSVCRQFKDMLTEYLAGRPSNTLTFYGSMYLSSFKRKMGVDRIDF